MEKEACFILGLLAIKQEYQASIAEAGALPGLVALLKRYAAVKSPPNPGAKSSNPIQVGLVSKAVIVESLQLL